MINKNIFRAYDIRGIYGKEITEDFAFILGKSFGSYIQELGFNKCIIGYDNRLSSPNLNNSLIKGVLSTGVNVISLGCVTTPMCYFASIKLNILPYIMITASHNPKCDNGFKFAFDNRGNARGKMISDFYEYTINGNFKTGNGEEKSYNIKKEYVESLINDINFGKRKLKVILDLGNGTTSIVAEEVFKKFNIDLEIICGENDGSFPYHHPDPSIEANLSLLKKKVLETNADIGISFDGDGDRIGLIDNLGKFIFIDKFMIVIIRDIINKVKNKTFLFDVKCSKSLSDEIIKLGGTPYIYRTGNSYTKTKIHELDLPFGGELSGHLFFRDKYIGIDSGIYAGLRILEILSKTDKKFSDLFEGINKYFSTPEIKIETKDEIKFEIIDKIIEYSKNKGYNILTIDGLRVNFEDGWALVRASNTGPYLTLRFEAKNETLLDNIKKEFTLLVNEYNV